MFKFYTYLDNLYQIDILFLMHIISLKALRDFWLKHPSAQMPLRNWHTVIEHSNLDDFNHLKQIYNSVDYVKPYTIFDVAGNNLRLITVIHYNIQKVYVRHVFTHSEYDDWTKQFRQGKVR